ncbi:MAG: hypothetical protein ACFFAS_10820 [Promethearchaeota archaeon]
MVFSKQVAIIIGVYIIRKMNIEEALLIIEGFQDALQEVVRSVDDVAFKSDVYMFSVYHLKKVIDKYKKLVKPRRIKTQEVQIQ